MATFNTRCLALSTALVAAAACGMQVVPFPGGTPQVASGGCPHRIATVRNPTTGAVNVFIDKRIQGGHRSSTKLGTVDPESTAEFPLSPDDGSRIEIAWASGSGPQDNRDLGQVRHKIQCQTEPRDF
jgi:hypothetical protein